MPAPKKGYSLASKPSHQRQMLSNLAISLFDHERIKTTEAKAKLEDMGLGLRKKEF